eukprot:5987711-Amphidinium_carterae.1
MCTTCLSTNWCEKDTCRSCGQSLAGSWLLQSGRWPPVGCPPEIVAKRDNYGSYDSAGSGTTPPPATGGSTASEHAHFVSQSHVANSNSSGRVHNEIPPPAILCTPDVTYPQASAGSAGDAPPQQQADSAEEPPNKKLRPGPQSAAAAASTGQSGQASIPSGSQPTTAPAVP